MRSTRVLLIVALLAAGACARPDAGIPDPAESASAYPSGGDLPPARRAAPSAPFSSDQALLADRVAEAIERYDLDRWERFVDAMDPGELAGDLRLNQKDVDEGKWNIDWLFVNGDELFEHDFGGNEGYGPGRARVHLGSKGGPDALSCSECHHRGGFDGAGDRTQNAFFDGDGNDPASAFERNPPHTLGLGPVQRIAEEMTADLQRARAAGLAEIRFAKEARPLRMQSKGVDFGTLVLHPDGTVDASGLRGVSEDLVVRPFGWKGSLPTIREFVIDGLQRHHGLQASGADLPGDGPDWDRDADGRPWEITEGMVTSMVAYLSLLEIPVMIPPENPALLDRHGRGADLFDSIGCAGCHVPYLPMTETSLKLGEKLVVDLIDDAEAPRPRKDVFFDRRGIPVYLYSDLKRHAMGQALAESRPTVQGIPGDVFLTRPLWGVADTGPWLHDGRAKTLDEAILLHGGEAQASRDAFARLSAGDRANVRIFLLSLTRYPRIEYR